MLSIRNNIPIYSTLENENPTISNSVEQENKKISNTKMFFDIIINKNQKPSTSSLTEFFKPEEKSDSEKEINNNTNQIILPKIIISEPLNSLQTLYTPEEKSFTKEEKNKISDQVILNINDDKNDSTTQNNSITTKISILKKQNKYINFLKYIIVSLINIALGSSVIYFNST